MSLLQWRERESRMHEALMNAMTRYKPLVKEFRGTALNVQKEVDKTIKEASARIAEGTATRELAISQMREVMFRMMEPVNSMANQVINVGTEIRNIIGSSRSYNATDATVVTTELLSVLRSLSTNHAMSVQTISFEWERIEVAIKGYVHDIQVKGLK